MKFQLRDISLNPGKQMIDIKSKKELMPLPPPYDKVDEAPPFTPLTKEQLERYECPPDGVIAFGIPKPKSKEEEERLVKSFLNGLRKLLSKEDNWTFVQILKLTMDYCMSCNTCSQACHVYLSSGGQEIYRPAYRLEVLRRIIGRYLDKRDKFASWFMGEDIELNWATIARLIELSYRCNICRRCAQWCPVGADNGLVTRELRKLFSQEMGIAPPELHTKGTVQQLKVGASTGIKPKGFEDMVRFMENDIEERTGRRIKIPVDKNGADILLIHNSGEFLSWLENPEAFAIIFETAGLDWTLSSEIGGYEVANYGAWYDDIQLARILIKQIMAAKKLGVRRIVVGECGHAHKALTVIADRILTGEMNIPRESFLPLLEDIVLKERIKLDPKRNNFPVTLHDPCNIVRLMGIVEPQRRILRKICPQFREMEPHGVNNYCCGGGSGFAIMNSFNFPGWKMNIASRMKFKQFLEAFKDEMRPDTKKYVCAPCSNCKGEFRDLISYYNAWEEYGIYYGGLVELVVNAMVDIEKPFITWEWR